MTQEDTRAHNGLTSDEAQQALRKYGRNELPQAHQHTFKKWLKRFIAPIPLMLLAAAGFSFALDKLFDAWFILALFTVNLGISVWHEWKAEHTLDLLKAKVTATVRTRRDGTWVTTPSPELVPGDLIELTAGSVVPADGEIISADDASTDEAALTGESLPVEKKVGDELLAGSFVTGGVITAKLTHTGPHTRFAQVALSTTIDRVPSILEQDILTISRFLSGISIALAVIISIVWIWSGTNILEVIRFDLTLLIAGIPVALPVVMSLIISIGTLELSKRGAIVRRLSSLEDMANVDLLLSDKTGTLTKNDIHVQSVELFDDAYGKAKVAALAAATASEPDHRTLERAIVDFAASLEACPEYRVVDIAQPDSVRKRSTALLEKDDVAIRAVLGAPQVVKDLSRLDTTAAAAFDTAVDEAAHRGFRTLALAIATGTPSNPPAEADLTLVALFHLSDQLRDDAKVVVEFLGKNGVGVKMVTGDNRAVSQEIAKNLGLRGDVISCQNRDVTKLTRAELAQTAVFSEVYPEDKESLVTLAQHHNIVAVTGDGVNDLPAVRAANVGIAVSNTVEVLKQTADIVLTSDGIGVIKNAVVESRKIFARIYSYSIYRISESFRLIIAVALFGVWLSAPILTPIQLIILALLNDLPIITLAFNRVTLTHKPATINVRRRFILSLLYGTVGLINSILFLLLTAFYFKLPWDQVQTLFFLKLTISGHMLLYVAHTKERWWRFLPSLPVIAATTATQGLATALAFWGFFMASVSWQLVLLVWGWSFFFMQITELTKYLRQRFESTAAAKE